MDLTLEIHCGLCGSANYSMPSGGSGEAPILCNDCGNRLGSLSEFRTEIVELALAQSAEALRRELDKVQAQRPA